MFYIFLFLFLCIYCYKIIIFNIVVKRHEQLVDVSAIKLLLYFCNLTACGLVISLAALFLKPIFFSLVNFLFFQLA